jgi:hypothetical protein
MAIDASQLLGSPQLAGVKVFPRGAGKVAAASPSGSTLGAAVGRKISANRKQKAEQEEAEWQSTSQTPDFGRFAYLAVSSSDLALIKLKSGLVSVKLDEVVVRLPRGDVRSAELAEDASRAPLTVTLAGGETWQLEVPRAFKKDAQAVVEALASLPANPG